MRVTLKMSDDQMKHLSELDRIVLELERTDHDAAVAYKNVSTRISQYDVELARLTHKIIKEFFLWKTTSLERHITHIENQNSEMAEKILHLENNNTSHDVLNKRIAYLTEQIEVLHEKNISLMCISDKLMSDINNKGDELKALLK